MEFFKPDFKPTDSWKIFRPLVSGLLLNAFYSGMILEKTVGKELTEDDKSRIWVEILDLYGRIDEGLKTLLDSENTTP
jgi:hypothetical protein